MPEFGALALLPIVVILIVAVATRRTLFALFCGTVARGADLGGWGGFDVWVEYTGKALSNATAQWLLLIVALFGILMMLFEKSGIVNRLRTLGRAVRHLAAQVDRC